MLRIASGGCALALLLAGCGSSGVPGAIERAPPVTAAPPAGVPELGPLIAGTSSWVDGHFVWTDYVYDDHGANSDGRPGGDGEGGYTRELANSADLVQVQLALTARGWSARFILQTLVDAQRPVTGLAIDADANPATGAAQLPGGSWPAQTPLGIEYLIVQRGTTAQLLQHVDGHWSERASLPVAIDLERNTLDLEVPTSLLDAVGQTWRVFALAGFADPASGASWPEGGAIMDLAFVGPERPYLLQTALQADVLAGLQPAERAAALVDFARAARRETALARVPAGAFSTFLHHSRLRLPEGVTEIGGAITGQEYLGPYQPYMVWMPSTVQAPLPLHVYLHGASQNHLGDTWVKLGGWPYHGLTPSLVAGYAGNNKVVGTDPDDVYLPSDGAIGSIAHIGREFAPYDAPGVVIFPLGRMNSSGYTGVFEEDVMEALADVRRRLPIDAERISLSGSSMGGIGSFRLGALYPDLWSHIFPIIGDGSDYLDILGNLLNLPVRMHNGLLDPLVTQPGPTDTAQALHDLGYDYRYWLFETREHESLFVINHCVRDEAFAATRNAQPAQVVLTLRRDLVDENTQAGYTHRYDRAWWVSDLSLRDESALGRIAALDLARADRAGRAEAISAQQQNLLIGRDVCGPNPEVRTLDTWTERGWRLTPSEPQPVSNALQIDLQGLASATLDLRRTALRGEQELLLELISDGAAELILHADWSASVALSVDDGPATVLTLRDGALVVPVQAGAHRYLLRP